MRDDALPLPRSEEVGLLAAALRADIADIETYARVLFSSLGEVLPAEMLEVERDRSLADRLAGRPGAVRTIRARFGEHLLEIARSARTLPVGAVAREVRGVVISRREVALDEWAQLLAEHLDRFAAEHAAAREALGRLLGA